MYYCSPISADFWIDTCFKRDGKDIISLKLHLAKILSLPRSNLSNDCSSEFLLEAAAQFHTETTAQSALDDLRWVEPIFPSWHTRPATSFTQKLIVFL